MEEWDGVVLQNDYELVTRMLHVLYAISVNVIRVNIGEGK